MRRSMTDLGPNGARERTCLLRPHEPRAENASPHCDDGDVFGDEAAPFSAGTAAAARQDRHPARRKAERAFLSRSEEHTSELQSHVNLVCRLLLEKKKQ